MRAHSGTTILRVGGYKMLATYHRPPGPAKGRFPTVIFLHGFPGSEKNVDVQRALMARGIASVAPNFLGAWGSGGTYRFTTLVAQARAVLRQTKKMEFVDSRRLALFGFSMGGWAALNTAALEPGLEAVAAVAPAGGPEMIGPGTPAFIKRLSKPLNSTSNRLLLADFKRAVTTFDPARAVAKLRMPLLLVHGDADATIPDIISRRLARLSAGPTRLVIERGAGHDFLDRRERLAALAAGWLSQRLTARR
jgi:pimeloyl-ACP methyl ester carboxylesterase